MLEPLTVGSCFSGIGGLELGLEWTGGFQTQWQIENDEYASRVLAKHWPNVQRFSDIATVSHPPAVDVICGGFPCQDVSLAGARRGLEGKRTTLWSEMFRLVCEVKPRLVLAENVPGLLSSDAGRFFGNILRDLASAGYDAEWGMLSAAGVGAPHLRKRIFIVANATSKQDWRICQSKFQSNSGASGEMANPEQRAKRSRKETRRTRMESSGCNRQWSIEPNVGRVAHGIPARVDRLRCLGNAVVPQVAQRIGEMILAYENLKVPNSRSEKGDADEKNNVGVVGVDGCAATQGDGDAG